MKKIAILLVLISSITFIYSCKNNESFNKTKSGLEYRFIVKNDTTKVPKEGDIVELVMNYTDEKDSLLFSTNEVPGAFRMQIKNIKSIEGSVDEGIAMMAEGDSAVFYVDAFTFFSKSKKAELPKYIESGSKLKFYIKLKKVLNYEEFEEERRILRVNQESEELNLLKKYLENANINILPSPTGLYYIETFTGTGRKPIAGKPVEIHYTGKFIDGKIFDSTYKKGQSFKYIYGVGQVISGMDEGVSQMKVGGKSTLVIPSNIAYGDNGYGELIPPYSTLIFEIELLDVKD